jgi:hypothetical protein
LAFPKARSGFYAALGAKIRLLTLRRVSTAR